MCINKSTESITAINRQFISSEVTVDMAMFALSANTLPERQG